MLLVPAIPTAPFISHLSRPITPLAQSHNHLTHAPFFALVPPTFVVLTFGFFASTCLTAALGFAVLDFGVDDLGCVACCDDLEEIPLAVVAHELATEGALDDVETCESLLETFVVFGACGAVTEAGLSLALLDEDTPDDDDAWLDSEPA